MLVNSASYRVNLDAMRACLEAGCHYVDLGGLYWLTGEQMELSPRFEAAGLLAMLGMGSSPGKTNVMAVRAVEELGAAPERIDVIAAGRDLDPPDGPSYPYAPRTLVDELTMAPMALRGGEPVELEPLQDGGAVDFPEPIGRGDTIYTLHSEVRTFGQSFGCARVQLPAVAGARGARAHARPGASLGRGDRGRGPGGGAGFGQDRVGARDRSPRRGVRRDRDRRDPSHGGLGAGRRDRVHRGARPPPRCACWRAGGSNAAGRDAARALRVARRTCSPSSSGAAARSRWR